MAEPLRYTSMTSTLGAVVLAWTDRGVRDVALGDDAPELERDLLERRPDATRHEGGGPHAEAARAAIDGDAGADVPLDVDGTDFQRRVWDALRAIPRGETRTYAELAAALGMPASASRAVGTACGANTLAVLIPCHRVIRGDGDLSGFRWGVARKRALLTREGALRQVSLL